MQIRPAATPEEVREAISLSRSRYFWLRFIAANWYMSAIVLVVVGVNVNMLSNHQAPKLGPSALMLAIAAAFIGFSWYRTNTRPANATLAAITRIEGLSLDPDGVRVRLKSGTTTFVPWSSFTKWAEGRTVFVLSGSDGTTILPIDEGNRDALRNLLSSNVS